MFDARQARETANAFTDAERKQKLLAPYLPAIQQYARTGKTSCTFSGVPDEVVWELRNLGYKVEVDLDRSWRIVSW